MKRFSAGLIAVLFVAFPTAAFAGGYYDYGYDYWYGYANDYGYGYSGYPAQTVYNNPYTSMPLYGCYGYFQYTPCTPMYQQPYYGYQQPNYYSYQEPYYTTYSYPAMYPQQYYNPYLFSNNVNINNNVNTNTPYAYAGYWW